MKRRIFLLFCILCAFSVPAQEITPIVTQYTKTDYHAANQNWDVKQGTDGAMYFGNNNCLLRYDGFDWTSYRIPRNKIIRSVYVTNDGKIYVGSFQEFGYFEKNNLGKLVYTSLSSQLKGYKMQNDEVWNILEYKGKIIFQSFTSFFVYDFKTVTGKRYNLTFLFFKKFKEKIYTHVEQNGFSVYDDSKGDFQKVPDCPFRSPMISIIPFKKDSAYVITQNDGIFIFDGVHFRKFQTPFEEHITNGNVNRACLTKDSLLVIGTIQNGVTALNKRGEIVWELNTSNILQNNTILGMYSDLENNLWLSLDKGIAAIHLWLPTKYIRTFSPSIGAIYTVSIKEPDNIFIGTNQGFYRGKFNFSTNKIENLIPDRAIKGQVWDISKIDNQYFCGNNEETFEVNEKTSTKISNVKGAFCIKKGIIHGKEVLVQGTYTDLCIYVRKGDKWVFSHSVSNFVNPIRYLEIDYKGTIWAAHMHEGLYSIQLKEDLRTIEKLTTYETLDGKNKLPVGVFSINNRIVFTDGNAIYTYDDLNRKIIPYTVLNKAIGRFAHAYRITPFQSNTYWFIDDDEAALIQINGDSVHILDRFQFNYFKNQMVDDYQNIIPLSSNKALILLENGFAIFQLQKNANKTHTPDLQISKVKNWGRENNKITLLPVVNVNASPVKVSYKHSSIRFTVFYPSYANHNDLIFRYRLSNIETVWSESKSNVKEYTYLPPDKYKFEAEVLNQSGKILSQITYEFTVNPPFYWNVYSKLFYLFVLIGIGFLIRKLILSKRFKLQQEQEEIRKQEIEKREQKIIKLKNEKLESELTMKSKELASSTMTIIRKNELLTEIKAEIDTLKRKLGSQYPNKDYDKLIKLLNENITSDEDWAVFQTNFDRIHENFFRNLHSRYPDLTANDLKFCAYLRLNLSSKDIANLMNISLKGVEAGRYRIRKKLNLPSDKNLSEFLIEFK